MVEARVDPETGDWSVSAPRRAARPDDRAARPDNRAARPDNGRSPGPSGTCPFCWGNEAMTPPEVLRVPAGADAWQVRVVPNLFPAVEAAGRPAAPTAAGSTGTASPLTGTASPLTGTASPLTGTVSPLTGTVSPLTGRHEVVIETGRHDWDLRRGGPDEVATILFAIRERCRALAGQGPAAVIAFRNYGTRAGASLAHPHSQIVSLDQAPPGLGRRWRRAREYHERTGTCLHDDLAAAERDAGERLILDTGPLLVFAPRAASVPHQTTLLPAERGAGLADASDATLTCLAATLPRVLTGLATVLDDPAYNLVVHAGPVGDPSAADWYRWHVTIYPRVTTLGGLEFATGVTVNPSTPETTAPALRRALPDS